MLDREELTLRLPVDLEQLRTLRAACHGEEICYVAEAQNESTEDHEYAAGARSDSEHPADLAWATFQRALDAASFTAPDRAILERMFTLMDKTGDDVVSCRELLVGSCLLLQGDLADKLKGVYAVRSRLCEGLCADRSAQLTAAVEIHWLSASNEHTRRVSRVAANHAHEPSQDALVFVLSTFATVASFFGDPLMKKTEIIKLVSDILPSDSHEPVDSVLPRLAQHPILKRYIHQLEVGADHHD